MEPKSPSQTAEWLECPIKRTLNYRMGLKPRRMGKGDIAAIGGRAFAKAMEVHYNGQGDPLQAAIQEIDSAKQAIKDQGRQVPDWEMAYYESIEPRITHSIRKYMLDDPIKSMGLGVEDVELSLPNHGYARIDLGVRDSFGLAVLDFKFKLRLDQKYYEAEVNKYTNSWQQYHYCWAYGEHKCEPVSNYYICLVVCEPKFSARIHEFPIHPETMSMWKESAERIWHQMDSEDLGLAKPWMAASHDFKYGPCPYKAACFTHRLDMNLMTQEDYVIEKEKDAP